MKREIRFRIFDGGRMIYLMSTDEAHNHYLQVGKGGFWLYHSLTGQLITCTANGGSLLQFTGLKDKNGKEIYDGDLIRCYLNDGRIGAIDTILYNDESAAFEFKRRNTTIKSFLENEGLFDTAIEVIGNVYENPDLA